MLPLVKQLVLALYISPGATGIEKDATQDICPSLMDIESVREGDGVDVIHEVG